jgi:hypothetical protein
MKMSAETFDYSRFIADPEILKQLERKKPERPKLKRSERRFVIVTMRLAVEAAGCLASAREMFVWLWLLDRSFERRGLAVTASTVLLEQIGINHHTKTRALRKLERHHFISVEWRHKRNPIVTILRK